MSSPVPTIAHLMTGTIFERTRELCTYERLLSGLLLLTVGLAAALSPMQSDTWWQLRAGRDMWTSKHVLLTDTYSHTAHGSFWPNHEWLSELIYYAAYWTGGLPLVTLFAAALIVMGWYFTWRLSTGPALQRFVLIAFALIPASLHWEPRPHAFSLLFTVMTVYLVDRRLYVWLPPLVLVWANCHGGVVLGLGILAVALGAATITEPHTWRQSGLTLVASVIAATVTPLGVQFWTLIPESLARIHQYPLDEWRASSVSDIRLLPFWIIAVVLCAVSLQRWRILGANASRHATICCASAFALLPFAIAAIRNVGLFLMLAVPAISALLQARLGAEATIDRRSRAPRPILNLTILLCAATLVAIIVAKAYRDRIDHLRWTPVPMASLSALQRCPDNVYNRYDEGGYLIWFVPQRPVFLDGRQDPYDSELVLEQIRVETTGEYRFAVLPLPDSLRLSADDLARSHAARRCGLEVSVPRLTLDRLGALSTLSSQSSRNQ